MFSSLFHRGFCTAGPEDDQEGEGGQGEGKLEDNVEGTGMGEGQREQDVLSLSRVTCCVRQAA